MGPPRQGEQLMRRILSVVTPCYNEEANVRELYQRVRDAIRAAGDYHYEHIFIDNASRDNTWRELVAIAAGDKNVKIIRNARNFGHIRSPMHAIYQATGDAVIGIVADLQDPPEMIRSEEHTSELQSQFHIVCRLLLEKKKDKLKLQVSSIPKTK